MNSTKELQRLNSHKVVTFKHPTQNGEGKVYFLDDALQFLDKHEIETSQDFILKRITKSLAPYYADMPLLVCAVSRINDAHHSQHGCYELVCINPLRDGIIKFYVDISTLEARKKENQEVDLNTNLNFKQKENIQAKITNIAILPHELSPLSIVNESIFKLVKNYIQSIHTKKRKEIADFYEGRVNIPFIEPKVPGNFRSDFGPEDFTLFRVAELFLNLREVDHIYEKSTQNLENFKAINLSIEESLQVSNDEKTRIREILNLNVDDLNNSLIDTKAKLETVIHFVRKGEGYVGEDLGDRWAKCVKSNEQLNDYKRYLAYAIYCAAGYYYESVVQKGSPEERKDKIESFNRNFHGFVQIESDGQLSDINLIYEHFSQKSLTNIQESINQLLTVANTTWFTSSKKLQNLVPEMQFIAEKMGQPFEVTEKTFRKNASFKWSKRLIDQEKYINETKALIDSRLKSCEALKVDERFKKSILQQAVDVNTVNVSNFATNFEHFKLYMKSYKDVRALQNKGKEHKNAVDSLIAGMDGSLNNIDQTLTNINRLRAQLNLENTEKIENYSLNFKNYSDQKQALIESMNEAEKTLDNFKLDVSRNFEKAKQALILIENSREQIEKLDAKIKSLEEQTRLECLELEIKNKEINAQTLKEKLSEIVQELNKLESRLSILNYELGDKADDLTLKANVEGYQLSYNQIIALNNKIENADISELKIETIEEDSELLQDSYAKLHAARDKVKDRLGRYKKHHELMLMLETITTTNDAYMKDLNKRFDNFCDFDFKSDATISEYAPYIDKLRQTFINSQKEIEDYKTTCSERRSVIIPKGTAFIDNYLAKAKEGFEALKIAFFAIKEFERFALLQQEFVNVHTKIQTQYNFLCKECTDELMEKDQDLKYIFLAYTRAMQDIENFISKKMVKPENLGQINLIDKVNELESEKNDLFERFAEVTHLSIELNNYLQKKRELGILHVQIGSIQKQLNELHAEYERLQTIIPSPYHPKLQALEDKYASKQEALEKTLKNLAAKKEIDQVDDVVYCLHEHFQQLKDVYTQISDIKDPKAIDEAEIVEVEQQTRRYKNNAICLKQFYELLINATEMLDAKRNDLNLNKDSKHYFRHGLQEKHSIIDKHLKELERLRANIEAYAGHSGIQLATLHKKLTEAQIKHLSKPTKTSYKELIQARKNYVDGFANPNLKIDSAQLAIRLDAYRYTVGSLHSSMQEHFVKRKQECKHQFLGGVRYWFSRFHERFVDSFRQFFSQHDGMTPIDNLSTKGTSNTIYETSIKKLGFFARKYKVKPEIPHVDPEFQPKEMVISPQGIRKETR